MCGGADEKIRIGKALKSAISNVEAGWREA